MNSFCLLSLRDSLSTCDTLIVKLAEHNNPEMYLLKNTAPNLESVRIAANISWAIVAVVAICVFGYILLKAQLLRSDRKAVLQKRREDLEDKIIKYKAEELSRTISAADDKQKKVGHFIDQYIESLKKNKSSVDYQKEKEVLMALLKEYASPKETSDTATETSSTSKADYTPLYNELKDIIKGYDKE